MSTFSHKTPFPKDPLFPNPTKSLGRKDSLPVLTCQKTVFAKDPLRLFVSKLGPKTNMTPRDVTGFYAFFSAQKSGNILHIVGRFPYKLHEKMETFCPLSCLIMSWVSYPFDRGGGLTTRALFGALRGRSPKALKKHSMGHFLPGVEKDKWWVWGSRTRRQPKQEKKNNKIAIGLVTRIGLKFDPTWHGTICPFAVFSRVL